MEWSQYWPSCLKFVNPMTQNAAPLRPHDSGYVYIDTASVVDTVDLDDETFFDSLSRTQNLFVDFVEKWIHEPWNFAILSRTIPFTFVECHTELHRKFDWDTLSARDDLQILFIKEHSGYPWNWKILSANRVVTQTFVSENIILPWDFGSLYDNVNIDSKFIKDLMTESHIAQSPNLDILYLDQLIEQFACGVDATNLL